MTAEFNREERYIVFKVSDLGNSFKGDEIRKLAREYVEQRRRNGKPPLECVVVESDWPEYEPTWKAIEARMTGAPEEYVVLRHLAIKMKRERDALQAKIEAMEKQEPYSYIYEYSNPIDGSPVWRDKPGYWNAQFPKSSKPLYLASGAQPAPSVTVDLITDYLVSISAHVAHQEEPQAQAEIGELLRMLAAAQEVKSCI